MARAWRWAKREVWSPVVAWARPRRAWLEGIGAVLAIAALVCSAWRCGGDWPTLVVAVAAVAVAWQFGRAQRDLGQAMRFLSLAPVLSAWFPRDYRGSVIEVQNAGNGPATDLQAVLLVRNYPQAAGYTTLPARCEKPHLGPGDVTRAFVIGPRTEHTPGMSLFLRYKVRRRTDIWILHCADLNGQHWHAASNFTPEQEHSAANEAFLLWRRQQSPEWIRRNCERCRELPPD